jgi:WD40 repeat protein
MGGPARIGVVFSGDGRSAALAEPDGGVSVWDVASGKERCRLAGPKKQGGVFGLGLSADGGKLVSRGKDETLVLWDATTGRELRRFATGPATGARKSVAFGIGGESVENYVFSPDGKRLATLDVDEKRNIILQVWDVAAGKELCRIPDPIGAGLRPPAFAAGGKTLVRLASDNSVRVHDAATGKELRRVTGVRADLFPSWTALAPDGRSFAAQTADGVVVLFDLDSGKVVRELGKNERRQFGASCTAIAFSPDGKTLAQGVGPCAATAACASGKWPGARRCAASAPPPPSAATSSARGGSPRMAGASPRRSPPFSRAAPGSFRCGTWPAVRNGTRSAGRPGPATGRPAPTATSRTTRSRPTATCS